MASKSAHDVTINIIWRMLLYKCYRGLFQLDNLHAEKMMQVAGIIYHKDP